MKPLHRTCRRLLGAAAIALSAASGSQAASIVVDATGVQSRNLLGEAGNTVLQVDVGAYSALQSLDWSVLLEAFAPSLLSELQFSFGSSSGLDTVTLAPAAADAISGSGQYSGSLDLSALGLAVGADGLLRIEFSEQFKDLGTDVADGRWLGGTLTFGVSAVPEPGTASLLLAAAAGLALAGRFRPGRRPG
ncbi:PEP-CTERM sorting domain-containing protein [Aquabacterium sp. OR-4]|uniref:PEP-CTERM sorting domain-containing protein n=1 Tax=Aquabacterium sp. OR-4 TaxID=2978127 RepID=UPI0021B3F41A|nr:PEP-CTERM sorting domain-containing protein [Aquabacterium sp. OR-4]MDT7836708.1 PEP-CTERM sorting domain-containing protein [Aquabacterium sp. OR-4]